MTTKPLVFLYNTAFIFTTMLVCYLSRRRVFWRVFVSSFWILAAVINGVLLMHRVTPFTGPDIKNLTDGLAIAKKYLKTKSFSSIFKRRVVVKHKFTLL